MQEKRRRTCGKSRCTVPPVTHGGWRYVADENVAQHTATQGGDKGQDQDAEQVEVNGNGGDRTFHGKEGGPEKVDKQHRVIGFQTQWQGPFNR